MIFGDWGEGEPRGSRLLWALQPYYRVCGQMTRGAGRGRGERHRRAGGWDRSVWRKPWNKLPPCPLRLIPPSHPPGHFLAPNPSISPRLALCPSHRLTPSDRFSKHACTKGKLQNERIDKNSFPNTPHHATKAISLFCVLIHGNGTRATRPRQQSIPALTSQPAGSR